MIILQDKLVRAEFDPQRGLNLVSLILDDQETIDQKTKKGFLESSRGLGPLIGPHFYHRNTDTIPFLGEERMEKLHKIIAFKGDAEPFSHGIARYVPWKITESNVTSFKAVLSSKDTLLDLTLAEIEGFDFEMHFEAWVTPRTLHIRYGAKSASEPVVVGLHTYYAKNESMQSADLSGAPFYFDKLQKKAIPPEWIKDNRLSIPLNRQLDFTFHPQLDREGFGTVGVKTHGHTLSISAKAEPQLSFQIYKDEDSSFVCIEPIAAINPRTVTSRHALIEVKISI